MTEVQEQTARVGHVRPEDATGELAEAFQRQKQRGGRVSMLQMVMGNVPEVVVGWQKMSSSLKWRYVEEDPAFLQIQEMVRVRTSSMNGGAYCLAHNIDLGREVGNSDEHVAAIQGDFEASPLLTDAQKTALRWADAVNFFQARDDDELFAEMQRHFTDRQIVELTLGVCANSWSNRFTEALRVPLESAGNRLTFHPQPT